MSVQTPQKTIMYAIDLFIVMSQSYNGTGRSHFTKVWDLGFFKLCLVNLSSEDG